MSGVYMIQTAIWIGPPSPVTLYMPPWVSGLPSSEECDSIRRTGQTFAVESEICSQVLSAHSPKVQLLEHSTEDDIGIFELQDNYPSRSDWVNSDWLMERDHAYTSDLKAGRKVACVGHSGKVGEDDVRKIKREAAIRVHKGLPQSAALVSLY